MRVKLIKLVRLYPFTHLSCSSANVPCQSSIAVRAWPLTPQRNVPSSVKSKNSGSQVQGICGPKLVSGQKLLVSKWYWRAAYLEDNLCFFNFWGSWRINGRHFPECKNWGSFSLWRMCWSCIQGSLWPHRGSSSGKRLKAVKQLSFFLFL